MDGEVKLRPKILGAALQLNRADGAPTDQEKERVKKAKRLAKWGKYIPGEQHARAHFIKQAAVATAAAPTFVRLENLRNLDAIQSTVNEAIRSTGHKAGGDLSKLFAGHAASVRFKHGAVVTTQVFLQQALPVLRRAWFQGRTNGPVGLARRWMRRHGWQETDVFTWHHPLTGITLGPQQRGWAPRGHLYLGPEVKARVAHELREAWKASAWARWLSHETNRGRHLQHLTWQQVAPRFRLAVALLGEINGALKAHAQAVLSGHFKSEAAYAVGMGQPVVPCSYCHSEAALILCGIARIFRMADQLELMCCSVSCFGRTLLRPVQRI